MTTSAFELIERYIENNKLVLNDFPVHSNGYGNQQNNTFFLLPLTLIHVSKLFFFCPFLLYACSIVSKITFPYYSMLTTFSK